MIDAGLEALVDDDYSDLSYKVLNIGTSNLFPAYSAEIGVRMDPAGSRIKAVEKVMEIASGAARVGDVGPDPSPEGRGVGRVPCCFVKPKRPVRSVGRQSRISPRRRAECTVVRGSAGLKGLHPGDRLAPKTVTIG